MFQPPGSMLEFVYRLLRGALYAFTFILWILGLSLIVFSFWYIYEGENYHLDNSIKFVVFTVSFVVGFVLLSLSLCGLAGVFKENMCLSKIFLIGMVLLILVELSFVFLIYAYKKEKFISEYADDDDVRVLVDTIQSDLKCCGISSPNDWDRNPYYKCNSVSTLACSVPASCCYNFTSDTKINMFCGVGVRRKEVAYQLIHVTGCKYSIHSFLDYKHKMTSSILTGVLIPQFIGLILIVSFIVSLKFLMEFDSIDSDLLKVIQFERDNKNNLITEIKAKEPSAPPFDEAFDPSAPIAMTEASKNLFSLNIGPNHDFLRRSKRNFNRNHQYRQEQEHVNPSFSAPASDFISD